MTKAKGRPSRAQIKEAVANVAADKAANGLRYNAGKTRYELLPPEWLRALAEVMTAGAEKYAPRNWEKGMDHSVMVGCLFRHLIAYMEDEVHDRETGCHHLAHAAWNLLALMSYDLRDVGNDDLRYGCLGGPTRIRPIPPAGGSAK